MEYRTKKITHKYGLEVPRNATHTYELDTRNNNTFWADAIKKEMKNVRVDFDIKEKDTKISPGHSYLDCHLIFDVKMDFTRKAMFVSNGSTTPISSASTYAKVLSRETVKISFTYAAFIGLISWELTSRILTLRLQSPRITGPSVFQSLDLNCKDVSLT